MESLDEPKGLCPVGKKAYAAIVEYLRQRGMTNTGGCRAFYSPTEWRERGEEYGLKSKLIVVYDGGDLRPFFNMDATLEVSVDLAEFAREEGLDLPKQNPYAIYEAMQAELAKVGLYSEECTGWYAAIYETRGP
jgi:hypothetical protein